MRILVQSALIVAFSLAVVSAQATTILTSSSATYGETTYSYGFSITDEFGSPGTYRAILENTTATGYSQIDRIAFNMDAIRDTDFTITVITPDWTVADSGPGVAFDYEGNADGQSNKLEPWDTLTFDFSFLTDPGLDPFSLWTGTSQSLGVGIGGGTDYGQVAVRFQSLDLSLDLDGNDGPNDLAVRFQPLDLGLDLDGNDGPSDLLASDWPTPVPEPATLLLFGTGLIGLAKFSTRKRQ